MRHEVHLAARGAATAGVAGAVIVAGAGVTAGGQGAASAAMGAALVLLNQAAAVATTAWSRTLTRKVATIGYLGWFVRMAAVLTALGAARSIGWVNRPALAISFCVTLAVLLGAECVSYVRRSYVPAWRMAR